MYIFLAVPFIALVLIGAVSVYEAVSGSEW